MAVSNLQTFVNEFQDYLFNQVPVYDLINYKRASSSDYFGLFKNTTNLLNEYQTNLNFLEVTTNNIDKEIETIISSLNSKLDKIEVYANTLLGINSSELFSRDIITLEPYYLMEYYGWNTSQKALTLIPKTTYQIIGPYSESAGSKRLSKYLIPTHYVSKYININKDTKSQISSISYLNDNKEVLNTEFLKANFNETVLLIDIPINTRYVFITYYGEISPSITLLSANYESFKSYSLPVKSYSYGNIFNLNSVTDLPEGCYIQAKISFSFFDVNNINIYNENITMALNNDNLCLKEYKNHAPGETIYGYWLNGIYTTDLAAIPDNAIILYKPIYSDYITSYTDSTLFLNVKRAQTVEININLEFFSLKSETQTPRLLYLTGITRNV